MAGTGASRVATGAEAALVGKLFLYLDALADIVLIDHIRLGLEGISDDCRANPHGGNQPVGRKPKAAYPPRVARFA